MEQPRHDIYTGIHKALRAQLCDSLKTLEICDFGSATERDAALELASGTLDFLDEHAGHEDKFVIPRIADQSAEVAARLASAHERVEQSGASVRALIRAIEVAESAVAVGRGPELCHAMNLLASEHLAHMNEEETLANATLWQGYTDQQLRELQGALQASIPPARMGQWLGIMLPALNVHERIGVMGGMRAAAPASVFEQTMALGRQVVGEPWGAVEAALG